MVNKKIKIEESNYCFFVKNFFSPEVVVGFTKPLLKESLPDTFNFLLSLLVKDARFSYMNQEHGSKVLEAGSPKVYAADGLFTKRKKHFLVVKTADCLPMLLADKDNRIGVVHMGWRSAKDKILENIPFDLSSLKVFAGVDLRSCCYQVGQEFRKYSIFSSYLRRTKQKLFFDPVKFAKDTLISQGLDKTNFFDSRLCSYCSNSGFFSYRKNKTKYRTFSFIGLK